MADYSNVGAFNNSSLNGEMINKLREAEEKARISPIEKNIETWDKEVEKFAEIKAKVSELLDTTKSLNLYNGSGTAFDAINASTTGSGAVFDAVDLSSLEEGTTTVTINTLAEKTVYQSSIYGASDDQPGAGSIDIAVGTGAPTSIDTTGKTITQIAEEMNALTGVSASVEAIGENQYRLVVKSTDTGVANKLTITQTGVDMGYLGDGIGVNGGKVSTAKDLDALIDGVQYNTASNSITIAGNLKITATEAGSTASINIQKDTSGVVTAVESFATKYNELLDMINSELYNADSPIKDKSSLKNMMENMKNLFYLGYGSADNPIQFKTIAEGAEVDEDGDVILGHVNVKNNDRNIFEFGIGFDESGKSGRLVIDNAKLAEALTSDPDALKRVFVGVAENEGLFTQLKDQLDQLNYSDGILTTYSDNMTERKVDLEAEKEAEMKKLDEKYQTMANQFAAYGAIISQMEASFGGLKMMIQQSTASN